MALRPHVTHTHITRPHITRPHVTRKANSGLKSLFSSASQPSAEAPFPLLPRGRRGRCRAGAWSALSTRRAEFPGAVPWSINTSSFFVCPCLTPRVWAQLLRNEGNTVSSAPAHPRRAFSKAGVWLSSQRRPAGGRRSTLTVTVILVVHRHVVAPGVGAAFDPLVIELSFPIRELLSVVWEALSSGHSRLPEGWADKSKTKSQSRL